LPVQSRNGTRGHGAGTLGRGKATADIFGRVIQMPKSIWIALYGLLLIAVVVGVDLLFFRNRLWERLLVNIGIVLVFIAFYLRILRNR
jgi:hypothetical protein